MPVTRYRSIEDMPDERWHPPGSPELWAAIRSVWGFSERTCPRQITPGVYKHHTIESLWDAEASWAQADFNRRRDG